jgi:hypothetical protein
MGPGSPPQAPIRPHGYLRLKSWPCDTQRLRHKHEEKQHANRNVQHIVTKAGRRSSSEPHRDSGTVTEGRP